MIYTLLYVGIIWNEVIAVIIIVFIITVLTLTRMITNIDTTRSCMIISSPSVVIIFNFIVLVENTFETCRVIMFYFFAIVITDIISIKDDVFVPSTSIDIFIVLN